jgi:hypothetical protein
MARSFVAVAARRDQLAAFETLHFAGYSLTGRQWLQALEEIAREQGWIARAAALRVKRLSWPLMEVVGLAVPTVAALCEMRYLWHTPHALVNRRMAALAGPEPHTPLAHALRRALRELGLIQDKALVQAQPTLA